MTAIVTTNDASTTIRVILQVVLYVNALYCAFVYFSQESFSNVIKNVNSDDYNEIVVYLTVLIVLVAFIFPLSGYIIWGDVLTTKTVAYLYYHFLGAQLKFLLFMACYTLVPRTLLNIANDK